MALTPFAFSSIFDDFLDGPLISTSGRSGCVGRSGCSMHVDLTEDAKAFHVKADLPGVKKDDIKVNVDGHALTLSVQQLQSTSDKEEETGGVKWHYMERSSQFMQRVVPLPDSADVKAIKTKYSNGVLHLDIDKKSQEGQWVQSIAID